MSLPTQPAASYIHAYREMWDGDEKNDTDEVKL